MNEQPTHPNAQLIQEAEDRVRFTCPLPPGSVMRLVGWNRDLELEVEPGGQSFVLVYEQRPLPASWPEGFCYTVWSIMARRENHVPEKFPGITVA